MAVENRREGRNVPPWALLLESCYERVGHLLPPIHRHAGHEMPEPYRRLLVHSRDMTPTLEQFYSDRLGLTVLAREQHGHQYEREVLLTLSRDGTPVEYGAIRMFLNHFPEPTRRLVLEEQRPLGSILSSEGVPHVGWPQAFFSFKADSHLASVLGLSAPAVVYGRRNVLLDMSRQLLAEVIEILAPVPAARGTGMPGQQASPEL